MRDLGSTLFQVGSHFPFLQGGLFHFWTPPFILYVTFFFGDPAPFHISFLGPLPFARGLFCHLLNIFQEPSFFFFNPEFLLFLQQSLHPTSAPFYPFEGRNCHRFPFPLFSPLLSAISLTARVLRPPPALLVRSCDSLSPLLPLCSDKCRSQGQQCIPRRHPSGAPVA